MKAGAKWTLGLGLILGLILAVGFVAGLRLLNRAQAASMKSCLYSIAHAITNGARARTIVASGVATGEWGNLDRGDYARLIGELLKSDSLDCGNSQTNKDGALVDRWGLPILIEIRRTSGNTRDIRVCSFGKDRLRATKDDIVAQVRCE